jgi:two-component system response regulator ChvI
MPLEAPRTRIVIVDDDDLFRESLGLNLAEQGFEVVDFPGGQPALDYLLAGNGADAVLLDWRMPGLDGPCF